MPAHRTRRSKCEIPELTNERISDYKDLIRCNKYLLHILEYPQVAHSDSCVKEGLPRRINTELTNHQAYPKIGRDFQAEYRRNVVSISYLHTFSHSHSSILASFLCVKHKWPISACVTAASAPVTPVIVAITLLGQITKQERLLK
jgi:hypothetical protein